MSLRKHSLHNNGEQAAVNTQLRRPFSHSRLRSEKARPRRERRHDARALQSPTGLRAPLQVLSADRPAPQTLFPKAALSPGVFLRPSMCVGSDSENAAQMLTGSSGVLPQFPRGSWGLSSAHRTEAVLQILERILRWKRKVKSLSR